MWSVRIVEVGDALPREFKVLPLVLADWNMCCPMYEYVGRLENGIREEPKLKLCSNGLV